MEYHCKLLSANGKTKFPDNVLGKVYIKSRGVQYCKYFFIDPILSKIQGRYRQYQY